MRIVASFLLFGCFCVVGSSLVLGLVCRLLLLLLLLLFSSVTKQSRRKGILQNILQPPCQPSLENLKGSPPYLFLFTTCFCAFFGLTSSSSSSSVSIHPPPRFSNHRRDASSSSNSAQPKGLRLVPSHSYELVQHHD